ncbi:unnamed protein product [Rotaria magnacalcarata]|nr:unnamed protein product [Rotaria magnacalcarata]CAF4250179.1 unnamed protein product [Rotaria magnacalcarata]
MDSCCFGPVVSDSNTSLRSDRTIDYAASIGVDLTIQAYEGHATSDHKPLLDILVGDKTSTGKGSRTIWPVFTLCYFRYLIIGEKSGTKSLMI